MAEVIRGCLSHSVSLLLDCKKYSHIPYFSNQMPHSISGRPRIIAAPPEGLNEINAALV